MNDPFTPFTLPRPDAPNWRHAARSARRALIRHRRDKAAGEERKRWNSQLNWREFWHGRTELESFPRVVQVGTNWTCNLKCSFCRLTMPWTQDQLKQLPGRQLQISDKVEAIVEKLLPYAEMMTLTPLGEPLMWRGLKDFLEIHQKLGSRNLALTTNGMLLKDATAEMLVRGELSQMYLSCDSNDPTVYAGMRVGGDLKIVEEGMRRVVAWKKKLGVPWPYLTLNSTFMLRNIPQLPSMVAWAQELGFDQISVQLMEIENPEHEPEFLGYHPQLARRFVTEALEIGRKIGMTVRPHLAMRNLISAALEGHVVQEHGYTASAPNMPEEFKLLRYEEAARVGAAQAAAAQAREEGGCATCACSAGESKSVSAAIGAGHGGSGSYGNVEGSLPDEVPAEFTAGSENLETILDMRGKTLVEKCHYPWYNLLIDTDGDARPCCWADLSFGNLNQLDFNEIWNGEKAKKMREDFLANHIPDSCRGKHCRVDL